MRQITIIIGGSLSPAWATMRTSTSIAVDFCTRIATCYRLYQSRFITIVQYYRMFRTIVRRYSMARWVDLQISRAGMFDDSEYNCSDSLSLRCAAFARPSVSAAKAAGTPLYALCGAHFGATMVLNLPRTAAFFKPVTSGWMLVPIQPYHAGGGSASFAPLGQHLEGATETHYHRLAAKSKWKLTRVVLSLFARVRVGPRAVLRVRRHALLARPRPLRRRRQPSRHHQVGRVLQDPSRDPQFRPHSSPTRGPPRHR